MDDFNRVRTRRESILRQKAGARSAEKATAPRQVEKVAEKSKTERIVRPENYGSRTARNSASSSIRLSNISSAPVKTASKKSQSIRAKITKKQILIIAASILIIAVVTVVSFLFLSKRSDEPKKTEPESKDAPIAVEEKYPKETATALDIAITESEIQITERGHYRLSGETTNPIVVNAPGEVVIYLNGINVSPTGATAISNLSGHPLTLILEDNTVTNLQTNSPDVNAIHSTGDLIIMGGGTLNVAGVDVQEGREYRKEATVNNLKIN